MSCAASPDPARRYPYCRWCEAEIRSTPLVVLDDHGHPMTFHPADERPCYRTFRSQG